MSLNEVLAKLKISRMRLDQKLSTVVRKFRDGGDSLEVEGHDLILTVTK